MARIKQTKRAKEMEKWWKEHGLKGNDGCAKDLLRGKTAADKKRMKAAGWKFP